MDEKLRGGEPAAGSSTATTTRRVSPGSLGLNRGRASRSSTRPARSPAARAATIRSTARSSARTRSSSTSAQARRDTLGARDRAAHRQPGRIGDGVRRDLARADDRARTSAADRPIVASMSDLAASGGYYIAMPAQVDRRAAVDADRLDRHLRRQVRHRRRLREARRAHRVDEHRQARRDELAGAPVQRRRAEEAAGAAAGLLRPVRREGRRARGTARRRRSTRSRRAASGPAGRRRRTAWWTSSAGSTARSRVAKQRAKIAADSDVELVVYPPPQELLRAAVGAARRLERVSIGASARGWRRTCRRAELRSAARCCAARSRCSAAARRSR